MKLEYLDSQTEKATVAILSQLGVSAAAARCKSDVATGGSSLPADVTCEHKPTSFVTYKVVSGSLIVDIRDEADCWIRATLLEGNEVSVPATVYRRLSGEDSYIIEYEKKGTSEKIEKRFPNASDSIALNTYHNYRELVCELCRQFFTAGWVTGTGGSISIRHGNRIYMTPSGVQKERIEPDELYVLDIEGEVLSVPQQKPGCRLPKLSDCSPLFLHAFKQRNAGAVLHSHSICCNLVTSLFEGETNFRISHQEMIKGINGYGYFDELCIPIIENTAWEHELADSLGEAVAKNPRAVAVLVRRHGMYVWGKTWEEAKRHGECLHYLFEVAIQMKKLGMDSLSAPTPVKTIENIPQKNNKKRKSEIGMSIPTPVKYVLFDIEGTTTPISFVKDVLFPYSIKKFEEYLTANWDGESLKADLLSVQAVSQYGNKQDIHDVVKNLNECVKKDLKIGGLKNIQGKIWDLGYTSGELMSEVYDDVLRFFQRSKEEGFKIAIYSSGSRNAQKLLFKYSVLGDLRDYISCYFDTSIGLKQEKKSYEEIAISLGVDKNSEIVFVTDVFEESQAATAAGMQTVLAVRAGNALLPANHGFQTVTTFDNLLK